MTSTMAQHTSGPPQHTATSVNSTHRVLDTAGGTCGPGWMLCGGVGSGWVMAPR